MSTLPLQGPKFRAFDANGNPLAGGRLYSFSAGTTTGQDTFTTRAGTVANTNPVVLNANGEADVWTTEGVLYKFVLKDASDVTQWTVDNFPSGAQSTSASDAANTIDPGGRLTLTSGAPVADVGAATTVFYTLQNHNRVPLYDGTAWTLTVFTELSQALSDATKSPAAAISNQNYDLFVWNDTGTIRLSRGPPWTSNTARGSGAGTTEISRVDGRLVNANAISNGPAAQRGLYVGTMRTHADGKAYDNAQARYLWNAYNRAERGMLTADPDATWSYTSENWRQANNKTTNQLDFVIGLAREGVQAFVEGAVVATGAVGGSVLISNTNPSVLPLGVVEPSGLVFPGGLAGVGIGLDSSTVNSAAVCTFADFQAANLRTRAEYTGSPGIGLHSLRWLERGPGDSFTYQSQNTYEVLVGEDTIRETDLNLVTVTQAATWYGTNTKTGVTTPTSFPVPYNGSVSQYTETVHRSGIWGTVFA